MIGITAKLYGGGGDSMAHSSVPASHGFEPAYAPRRRLTKMLTTNSSTPTANIADPIVVMRFTDPHPALAGYVYTRLGIPNKPLMCIGKKPRLNPMNIVQKFHLPNVSLIMRPVILGIQ